MLFRACISGDAQARRTRMCERMRVHGARRAWGAPRAASQRAVGAATALPFSMKVGTLEGREGLAA
jgi:hypothetical protein